MRNILFILILTGCVWTPVGAQTVPDSVMNRVYEEVRTPYKYGMVMVPATADTKMDCPSVFRAHNKWYMTYIVFDGTGYETWLARSNDLLHWKVQGKILVNGKDTITWDAVQKAGYIALQDPEWGRSYALESYRGRYWMSYFGGNTKGYEAGSLSIGIAFSKKDPASVHTWETAKEPVLRSADADVRWWEDKKLFKSTVIWDKQKLTGHPFVMYYNANGDTSHNRDKKTRWYERIGMAVSDDMLHWKRFLVDPVMHHPAGLTGDAVLQKMGNVWVMFYFGAFWEKKNYAFNRFACSYDLVHWTDWKGDDLIKPSEPFDAKYAHKSFVVKWKGVVYHFYCAVDKADRRGIAVATSVDKSKSPL